MSVKLSDIIWTIICFGLFTLVVNELLLKPVLRFMDARKARIEKAGELARESEEAAKKAEEKRLQALEKAKLLRAQRIRERIESSRQEAQEAIAARSSELNGLAEAQKQSSAAFGKETEQKLMQAVDGLAEAFAEKLISGGQR